MPSSPTAFSRKMASPSGSTQSGSTEYSADARSPTCTVLERTFLGAVFAPFGESVTVTFASLLRSVPSKAR